MRFSERYMVKPGAKVRLKDRDPGDTAGLDKEKDVLEATRQAVDQIADLQYRLYAEGRQSLLIVLQAMDAGGKDGTINHVFAPLNPQGCRVVGFKEPSTREQDHDFLWRIHAQVPRRGEIVVFNRSHYEDVLVVRVHKLAPRPVWSQRFRFINDFEKLLAAGGTRILKFYLHIDEEEQLERFKQRLDDPRRHWKISDSDYRDRQFWPEYRKAYEEALARCSTEGAPWFIIPSNHKWFRNLAVSQIVLETLRSMKPEFPAPSVDLAAIGRAYHRAATGKNGA